MPRLIAAVDLSDISQAVVSSALVAARRLGCSVRILHAVEPLCDEGDEGLLIAPLRRWVERVRRDRDVRFSRFISHLKIPEDIEVDELLVRGRGFVEIAQQAVKGHARLVVIGMPHPRTPLGSTISRVSSKCPCPLLIARRPPAGGEYTKVVVGVDFSPFSANALRRFHELCAPGSQVTLCHVVDESDVGRLEEDRDEVVEHLRGRLQQWGTEHLEQIEFNTEIRFGDPRGELTDCATELGATLLVVGNHGISAREISHLLLGGVAESVAYHSPCDVLIYSDRSHKKKAAAK
jgi:nucleotide-binding universal stress UspA family protein